MGPAGPAFKQIGAPNQIMAIRDVANHHLRQEVPGPAVDLLHLACVAGRVTAEAASRFRFPATAQGETANTGEPRAGSRIRARYLRPWPHST